MVGTAEADPVAAAPEPEADTDPDAGRESAGASVDALRPESISRLRRFKSESMSEACW